MIQRISAISPLPYYMLSVLFDDGRRVLYDVKDDIKQLPGFRLLKDVTGLFEQVQLDKSHTCVFWNDEIDLPSHAIYEQGKPMQLYHLPIGAVTGERLLHEGCRHAGGYAGQSGRVQ